MEPVSSAITTGQITKVVAPAVLRLLNSKIMQKWADSRLTGFIVSLGQALKANDSDAVQELTTKIENHKYAADHIPEMIRAVCVGKSKTYAPKVCAMYVAKIIRDDIILNQFQAKCIAAISDLYDDEIDEFWCFIQKHPRRKRDKFSHIAEGKVDAYYDCPEVEADIHHSVNGSDSYFSLASSLGRWAVVFEEYQLIRIQQIDRLDIEDRDDVGRTVSTRIHISADIRELEEYLSHFVNLTYIKEQ